MCRSRRLEALMDAGKFQEGSLIEMKDFVKGFKELDDYWQLNTYCRIMEYGESPLEALGWAECERGDADVFWELDAAAECKCCRATSYLRNYCHDVGGEYILEYIDYEKIGEQMVKDKVIGVFYDPEEEREDYYLLHD